ncbi:ATPase domain-containing protein [archaeon]
MERVPTGIEGLDNMIEGGFPRGRTVLLSGGCGTGKSIFAMQYLFHGAAAYNEPGVYVTVDERPELTRQDMLRFGWDVKQLEDEGKLVILDLTGTKTGVQSEEKYSMSSALDIDRLVLKIMQTAGEIGARRLVIDSIPALGFRLEHEQEARNMILKLSYMIRKSDLTALLISEIPEQTMGAGPMQFSKYGVEEYVADSVILLHYLGMGTDTNRTLYIRKMRGTKHVEDIIPLHITEGGIKLVNPEEAFSV